MVPPHRRLETQVKEHRDACNKMASGVSHAHMPRLLGQGANKASTVIAIASKVWIVIVMTLNVLLSYFILNDKILMVLG